MAANGCDHAAMSIINARAFEEIASLHRKLELESDFLRREIVEIAGMGELVGQSAALQNVVQQIDLVAPTDANVLVLGESGTGKELVAREIHERSRQHVRPMIKVNCASIPRDLFESEFFGHAKGAFTGAINNRAGRFRSDLYYRLNVFPIEVAPLRRRKEDLLPLASLFLQRAARRFIRPEMGLTQANLLQLQNYDWPGNVRELQNVIERAVIVSKGNRLSLDLETASDPLLSELSATEVEGKGHILTEMEIRELEKQNIEAALQQCAGRIYGPEGAACLLELPPTTLSARINKMGIKKA